MCNVYLKIQSHITVIYFKKKTRCMLSYYKGEEPRYIGTMRAKAGSINLTLLDQCLTWGSPTVESSASEQQALAVPLLQL